MKSIIHKKIKLHNDHAQKSAQYVLDECPDEVPEELLERVKLVADGTLKRFSYTEDSGIDKVHETLGFTGEIASFFCVHDGIYDDLYERAVDTYHFDMFFCFMDLESSIEHTFSDIINESIFNKPFEEYSKEYNGDRCIEKLASMEARMIEMKKSSDDYWPALPGMIVFTNDNGGNGDCVNRLNGNLYFFDHEIGLKKVDTTMKRITKELLIERLMEDEDEIAESPDKSILDSGMDYEVSLL